MVTKWAGSIEIGVTTHAPSDLEFPSTMTNVSQIILETSKPDPNVQIRSGTWMMTGNGVMHNGTTTVDDYGQNLDKLKASAPQKARSKVFHHLNCTRKKLTIVCSPQVGDRVAVVRKESGVLHFFVNSEDQVHPPQPPPPSPPPPPPGPRRHQRAREDLWGDRLVWSGCSGGATLP